jgi:hypothetical protein
MCIDGGYNMFEFSEEIIDKFLNLEEEYIEMFKEEDIPYFLLFPKVYYDIDDLNLKIKLLSLALSSKKKLHELDCMIDMQKEASNRKLEKNIRITREKM